MLIFVILDNNCSDFGAKILMYFCSLAAAKNSGCGLSCDYGNYGCNSEWFVVCYVWLMIMEKFGRGREWVWFSIS